MRVNGVPLCSVNSTEVLCDALRDLLEQDDDLDAVRDALAEWKDGDAGMPLAEAFEVVRSRTEGKGHT